MFREYGQRTPTIEHPPPPPAFVPFSTISPVFTTLQTWITWLSWDTFTSRSVYTPCSILPYPRFSALRTHSSNSCLTAPHPLLSFSCGLSMTMGFYGATFTNSHAQPRLTIAISKFLSFRNPCMCVCLYVDERKSVFWLTGAGDGSAHRGG